MATRACCCDQITFIVKLERLKTANSKFHFLKRSSNFFGVQMKRAHQNNKAVTPISWVNGGLIIKEKKKNFPSHAEKTLRNSLRHRNTFLHRNVAFLFPHPVHLSIKKNKRPDRAALISPVAVGRRHVHTHTHTLSLSKNRSNNNEQYSSPPPKKHSKIHLFCLSIWRSVLRNG